MELKRHIHFGTIQSSTNFLYVRTRNTTRDEGTHYSQLECTQQMFSVKDDPCTYVLDKKTQVSTVNVVSMIDVHSVDTSGWGQHCVK